MILWLDHLIFGNGYGMATPYSDGAFYWLDGELYTAMSGFGAQLHSYQWTHPKAGEERRLCGRLFRPLCSERRWCRVEVAWHMVGLDKLPLDAAHRELSEFRKDLLNWGMRTKNYVHHLKDAA